MPVSDDVVYARLCGRFAITRELVVRLGLTLFVVSTSVALAVFLPKVDFIFDLMGSTVRLRIIAIRGKPPHSMIGIRFLGEAFTRTNIMLCNSVLFF